MTLKILSTAFNTFFPVIPDMRHKLFSFEEKLGEFFMTPFTTIPIPDDAPAEIPRIQARSHHGHSELNVSLDRISFLSRFDEQFNNNWNRCETYLNQRAIPITSMVQELVDDKFLYSGLTTEVAFEGGLDPIQHFKNKFFKTNSKSDPYDMSFKLTYVVDEKFYINISLQNQRIYTGQNSEVVLPAYLEQIGTGIVVLIDVNDRHGFNFIKEYHSKAEDAKKIIEISSDFIQNKLLNVIEKGEFDL
jgi:hypothetical protein